jgi:hypothetical protein
MTSRNNPTGPALTDADRSRLSSQTQEYVAASCELMGKAHDCLRQGDLRQASEEGWGSAAQIVKAAAEHWRGSGVVHGRRQDLRALVNALPPEDGQSDLVIDFRAAQDLRENFYENNTPSLRVTLDLAQTDQYVLPMLPQLRRPEPPEGFRQSA